MVATNIDSLSWDHGMVRAVFICLNTCARSFQGLPCEWLNACTMQTDGKRNGRAGGSLPSRLAGSLVMLWQMR
jgi:hypothetical protein